MPYTYRTPTAFQICDWSPPGAPGGKSPHCPLLPPCHRNARSVRTGRPARSSCGRESMRRNVHGANTQQACLGMRQSPTLDIIGFNQS